MGTCGSKHNTVKETYVYMHVSTSIFLHDRPSMHAA